jgi:hypothetical protein
VGRIVLWRENYHRAILDFCNNICQKLTHAAQQTITSSWAAPGRASDGEEHKP